MVVATKTVIFASFNVAQPAAMVSKGQCLQCCRGGRIIAIHWCIVMKTDERITASRKQGRPPYLLMATNVPLVIFFGGGVN